MAIYHYSAQVIKRSDGRSAVNAAAYRAAGCLIDNRLGVTFNYTSKARVDYSEILTPHNAQQWAFNREQLWNYVEAFEKRSDAQVSREVNAALPIELSKEQMIELGLNHARQFVEMGMIADINFHDLNSHNPHIHIQLTMRPLTEDGELSKKKERNWNSKKQLNAWRRQWTIDVNESLRNAGHDISITEKSFEDLGIKNQMPSIHEGPCARAINNKGTSSERVKINQDIKTANLRLHEYNKLTSQIHDISDYCNKNTLDAKSVIPNHLEKEESNELLLVTIIESLKVAKKKYQKTIARKRKVEKELSCYSAMVEAEKKVLPHSF